MALNDFTGQNIQDTYQKVVQTDGTNLADGTGSLLPISFDGNNVTISGSLTANEYIVSSSVTNITIATLSGSTEFGDTTDDTHTFIGNITASGNISASGQIDADKIRTGGRIASSVFDIACAGSIDTDGTISSTGISNSSTYTGGGRVILSGASSYIETPSYVSASSLISQTHITASGNISATGNISASGVITANAASFDGTIIVNAGGTNTDGIKIGAESGNRSFLTNVNGLRLQPTQADPTNAATPHVTVGIGGHITASGNISASGFIQTPELRGTGTTATLEVSGIVSSSEFRTTGDIISTGGSLTVPTITNVNTTHITSSGNISASGGIALDRFLEFGSTIPSIKYNGGSTLFSANATQLSFGEVHVRIGDHQELKFGVDGDYKIKHINTNTPNTLQFQSGSTPVFELGAGGHITASGNISSSGDLTANNITGVTSIESTLYTIDGQNAIDFANNTHLFGSTAKFSKLRTQQGLEITAPITASGNISASGDLIVNNINGIINGGSF
mgnify:FL=1